ncbi:MAG: cob(I)yrinic acid a,c-diamide adenosyltransferase [Bacillota bacterium]
MTAGKGLVIVYTGDGKGKTTAALGLALRACGHGFRVLMVQFIKGGRATGERLAAPNLPGFELRAMGEGFTLPGHSQKSWPEHRRAVAAAWDYAQERALSGEYRVLILDEINYVLAHPELAEALPTAQVLDFLRRRPPELHVVLTGRRALPELVAAADLVTTMEAVKHPWADQGLPAQRGIDF